MKHGDLIKELGALMNMPQLALDENGTCQLVFDKCIEVNFEQSPDGQALFLYSVVSAIPPEGREAFYEQLLEANLFGGGTGGATFAVNPDSGEVVLFQTVATETVEFSAFAKMLESYVDQLQSWSERLANAAPEPTSTSVPADFMSGAIRA